MSFSCVPSPASNDSKNIVLDQSICQFSYVKTFNLCNMICTRYTFHIGTGVSNFLTTSVFIPHCDLDLHWKWATTDFLRSLFINLFRQKIHDSFSNTKMSTPKYYIMCISVRKPVWSMPTFIHRMFTRILTFMFEYILIGGKIKSIFTDQSSVAVPFCCD